MDNVTLQNITVTPLARISTPGGDVMHALKKTEKVFAGFGEAYFTWAELDYPKAWKRHAKMTLNLIVPSGEVRFVFHIAGQKEFRVEDIGTKHYARITVPPGVWFGFKGLATQPSLVLNVASIPHSPDEVERLSVADLPYDWS